MSKSDQNITQMQYETYEDSQFCNAFNMHYYKNMYIYNYDIYDMYNRAKSCGRR